MTYEIPHDLKEKTHCDKDFRCLICGEKSLCHIDKVIEQRLFFITEKPNPSCHAFDFGGSLTCRCPIRVELKMRLNI